MGESCSSSADGCSGSRSANEQRAQLRLPALEVNDRGGLSYCFQWVHLTGVQPEQRRKRKKKKKKEKC